ncbi:hypothetical protein BASA81_012612 [Batrachochytrium salamandrivorans]|nr:hypothetical protein BASA81_012612 [Batrachochytrium salamandrivorans]
MPTCVVVGAGLSGLACARELKHLGWDVRVVEARARPGGRVFTTHEHDVPVDVGASFIHGIGRNPVAKLAMASGGDLYSYSFCPLFDEGGQLLDHEMDLGMEQLFNLTLAQASKRHQRFPNESLEHAVQSCVSLSKLSRLEQRAFNWHLSNLEYSVNANLSEVRNNGWDADDAFGLLGRHCLVRGGMGRVIDLLLPNLDITYNTKVVTIDYSCGKGVEINHGTFQADVCVCTLPLGVLKSNSVQFLPKLPKDKLDAITKLGFGVLNKVALSFAEKFWTEELFGYCSKDRGKFPIFVDSAPGHAVLTCLLSGSSATDAEECSDNYLVRQMLVVLRKIYPSKVTAVVEYQVTRWHTDEFAKGSYSFVAMGSSPRDYDVLARPIGGNGSRPNLFFAGEATNRMFPASVHGAFFSGVREAKRIHLLYQEHDRLRSTKQRQQELSEIVREEDVFTKESFADLYSPSFTFPIHGQGGGVIIPSQFPASEGEEEEEEEEEAPKPKKYRQTSVNSSSSRGKRLGRRM